VKELYNSETIARTFLRYGIVCTPPKKDGATSVPKYVTLEEAQYLKCGFRREPECGELWHMTMEPYVMHELTNWVRQSPDPVGMLRSNLEDAMRFAYGHGRIFFDELALRINHAMEQARLGRTYYSFDILHEEWLQKHGRGQLLYHTTAPWATPLDMTALY